MNFKELFCKHNYVIDQPIKLKSGVTVILMLCSKCRRKGYVFTEDLPQYEIDVLEKWRHNELTNTTLTKLLSYV